MSDCKEFLEFWEADKDRAEGILTRICESHYNRSPYGGVDFDRVHEHNALNYTLSGTVKDGEDEFRFIIDDGNWNGTEVREWGTDETVGMYDPPPPTIYDMEPISPLEVTRPEMWKVYLLWREEPWFKDMCHGYMYDSHFAPGGKTESHWREKANKRGLRITTLESVLERIENAKNVVPFKPGELESLVKEWGEL